ncbi:MAG: coproporphyrinogen dehydrogenase HemZ [Anaerovoracaceae bacterium]
MSEETPFRIRIRVLGYDKMNLLKELIDEFLPPDRYELVTEKEAPDGEGYLNINESGSSDRDTIKRELFRDLYAVTGEKPDWGILTGVRPVKLAGERMEACRKDGMDPDAAQEEVIRRLMTEYFLSREKAELITSVYRYQIRTLGYPPEGSLGVYIGIPFCPTRCLYCSFASNQVPDSEIERYLPALLHEIEACGELMNGSGMQPESIYIGGGTPTTLVPGQLDLLISRVERSFDLSKLREFTVEAGRPDTITVEKLRVLKDHGVSRISINPQSMKQETLDRIGRSHTPEQIRRAFEDAGTVGFDVINADLIAGLPGESPDDFIRSLREIMELGANNITTHTLAVKRASRLKDVDEFYYYKVADLVGEMLRRSGEILTEAGFRPYYLYRQKHMAGYHENTGFALPGAENLYNVRIMDEHQSILALGAGGISKRYYPETNRLERVANVTNYQQYIGRIDEMIQRKRDDFFPKKAE